jgi:hypothetical protein
LSTRKFILLLFATICIVLSLQSLTTDEKTAVIIDSIASNSNFKQRSLEILTENGYKVQYVSGENVTVDYLKNIPAKKDMYIFRVHSTCINNRTWIFTGEKYTTESYPILQLTDLIHKARPSLESGYYFCISPDFIREYDQGSFKDGTVLMMGCEGFSSMDLAEAFCAQGAIAYVSWDGNVCLKHTDETFITLLDALCARKLSISASIMYTKTIIGDDPVYYSTLKYYPEEHGYLKVS